MFLELGIAMKTKCYISIFYTIRRNNYRSSSKKKKSIKPSTQATFKVTNHPGTSSTSPTK